MEGLFCLQYGLTEMSLTTFWLCDKVLVCVYSN